MQTETPYVRIVERMVAELEAWLHGHPGKRPNFDLPMSLFRLVMGIDQVADRIAQDADARVLLDRLIAIGREEGGPESSPTVFQLIVALERAGLLPATTVAGR
jgi:hypothetical protein